jgi:hypothetical protein
MAQALSFVRNQSYQEKSCLHFSFLVVKVGYVTGKSFTVTKTHYCKNQFLAPRKDVFTTCCWLPIMCQIVVTGHLFS